MGSQFLFRYFSSWYRVIRQESKCSEEEINIHIKKLWAVPRNMKRIDCSFDLFSFVNPDPDLLRHSKPERKTGSWENNILTKLLKNPTLIFRDIYYTFRSFLPPPFQHIIFFPQRPSTLLAAGGCKGGQLAPLRFFLFSPLKMRFKPYLSRFLAVFFLFPFSLLFHFFSPPPYYFAKYIPLPLVKKVLKKRPESITTFRLDPDPVQNGLDSQHCQRLLV